MSDQQGSQSGRDRRPADIWLATVGAADSERHVVAAALDYLATWTPSEISRLPTECRPGRIKDGDDISDMAYKLSREHLSSFGPLDDRLLLERLMGFFVHAAARIAELRSHDRHPTTEPQ